jgi:hypothetical protein
MGCPGIHAFSVHQYALLIAAAAAAAAGLGHVMSCHGVCAGLFLNE